MTDQENLSERETRMILTPFAFKIDESLFGIALAAPSKRALAIIIDFILVALLSETSGEILALLVAFTCYRLGHRKRVNAKGKAKGRKRGLLLRLAAGFIVLLVLAEILPNWLGQSNQQAHDEKGAKQSQVIDQPGTNADQAVLNPQATEQSSLQQRKEKSKPDDQQDKSETTAPVIKWIEEKINDLGLGFGWAAFYFTMFTALWHGQTPGKKIIGIQVLQLDGTALSVWDSFGRYGGYVAGVATGSLGFMQVMWDPNRQAIHDKISATIVIDLDRAKGHLAKSLPTKHKPRDTAK